MARMTPFDDRDLVALPVRLSVTVSVSGALSWPRAPSALGGGRHAVLASRAASVFETGDRIPQIRRMAP